VEHLRERRSMGRAGGVSSTDQTGHLTQFPEHHGLSGGMAILLGASKTLQTNSPLMIT
jgi:hypothetical protein